MIQDPILQQIVSLLSSYKGVERIYLFGSRANGTAYQHSDYDIAIETNEMTDKEFNLLYLQVQEEILTLHKIDLLHLNVLHNPILLENITLNGNILYEQVKH